MKKLLKISCVLVGLSILCGSCHKNPNDFLNGKTWKFTSYQINGIEQSHDFDNLLAPHTLTDVTIAFDFYQNEYTTFFTYVGSKGVPGYYNWSSDSKSIWLAAYPGSPVSDSSIVKFDENVLQNVNNSKAYWTVVKLNTSTFHISRNGVDIYFKMQ